MKKYSISANLIRVVKHLHDKATSAVLFNGSIGDLFRATVGVQQGCLLSPTFFNVFLERINIDVLEDHEGTVSIGGRAITYLRFADDIDSLGEVKLAELVERLGKDFIACRMEIRAEKTKLMTNISGINTETKENGQKVETATSFKCLGPIITDEGSKPEILSRISQTTAAFTRFKQVWNTRSIFSEYQDTTNALPCHIHLPVWW